MQKWIKTKINSLYGKVANAATKCENCECKSVFTCPRCTYGDGNISHFAKQIINDVKDIKEMVESLEVKNG